MKECRTRQMMSALIILAVLSLICIFGAVYHFVTEKKYEILQNEVLEELERNNGTYDESSIVLQSTSKARAEDLAQKFGAELRISGDGRFAALHLPEGVTIRDVFSDDSNRMYINEMSADYQVRIADINEVSSERVPVRPDYDIKDIEFDRQQYFDYINMQNVWKTRTGKDITVAVIDTGIDTDHPEFSGRISEYSYNASKDKIVKDWKVSGGSYDWSLIEDEQGHGTAVAGVIASSMNNGNIVGVAPEVNLLVIKVECSPDGTFTRASDLVFGLYYAIERDVQVINMSFTSFQNYYSQATQLAVDSDIFCVAAAGNYSTCTSLYPASDPNVIGVGALEVGGWGIAEYSNFGDNSDIVAPGTTYTSLMGGGYGNKEGTSLASPIVAGALALFSQNDKYKTFEDMVEILYASCYDLGTPGEDWTFGYGALDVSALILEERGTIIYDMLTDEIDNQRALFIRGHSLQSYSEPERLYSIFDGWYYDDKCTDEVDYYFDEFEGDITLYAKWINESDGVPYTYNILNDGTVEILSYTGRRKYITIPEKIEGRIVTSVGSNAFSGQDKLRKVVLPKGLKKIDDAAFDGCVNLLTIEIPESVEQIGVFAFRDNISLNSVDFIGDSKLTVIGSGAFEACGLLQSIELPKTLTKISGSAFCGAVSLRRINVQSGNRSFVSKDGVLFNYSCDTLVSYPVANGTSYVIPAGVKNIGDCAFAYAQIESINLFGIESIGASAFIASYLNTLDIPDSVTYLGASAFLNNSRLLSLKLGRGLSYIPISAFDGCYELKSLIIPNGIKSIDSRAFYSGVSLDSVVFEENSTLETIGYASFANCNISQINIPASVRMIDESAFFGTSLERVEFANNSKLASIGASAFKNTVKLQSIEFPDSLVALGDFAFYNSGLLAVNVPENLTQIGIGAFAACHSLENISVNKANESYKDINGVVFSTNEDVLYIYPAGKKLTEYTVKNTVTRIAEHAFSGTEKLKKVVFNEGLIEFSENSFRGSGITDVAIPDSVNQISRYTFAECWDLTSVQFGKNSSLARLGMGSLAYSGIESFTVPANISTMSQEVFEGCKNLTSVIFSANSKLESISAYTFSGCDALREIRFSSGSCLKHVQAHSFEGIPELRVIDFGDAKLTNIDNYAFRFCVKLTTITLPQTVIDIGRYAFYGCSSIARIVIPASVEHIGRGAFNGTKNFELYFAGDSLPEYLDEDWDCGVEEYYVGVTSVETSGDYKYATLSSGKIVIIEYLGNAKHVDLTKLNLGAPITAIGGSAFKNSSVETIVLPSMLTEIQAEAFMNAPLKSISLPESVNFIGRSAFAYTDIKSLEISSNSSLKVIEQYAFESTENLLSVKLPSKLERMGTGVFLESGLTKVEFDSGIKLSEIPEAAFAMTKLTSVSLPDSVTLVNHNAFNGIRTLKSISFGKNDGIRLMSSAFYQTGLTSLNIPSNVTYIGEFCFVALQNLKSFSVASSNKYYAASDGLLLTKDGRKLIAVPAGKEGSLMVPKSVEEIGFGAFEESKLSKIEFDPNANILTFGYRAFFKCENITEIKIPKSVVAIDYYAFGYCENLQSVEFEESNSLTGIYEGVFCGDINLSDITLPNSIMEITEFAFYGCSKIRSIPTSENSNIIGIYDYAFAYSGLSGECTVSETVIDIGECAFLGTKLTSIAIPDTNKEQLVIGMGAFESCNRLQEITVPFIGSCYEDEDITWFGYIFGAGSYEANESYVPTSLKTVNLSEGMTLIGQYAFYRCSDIETINIPASVNLIGFDSFAWTRAKHILPEKATFLDRLGEVSNSISSGYFGTGISGNVKIPEGIEIIQEGSFEDCVYLESVIIPASVKSIGNYAFSCCRKLNSVVFEGKGITELSERLFNECESLNAIIIPESVKKIKEGAFFRCSALSEITIPKSVTSVDDAAFMYCSNLKSVKNNSNLKFLIDSESYGWVAYYADTVIDKNGNKKYRTAEPGTVFVDTEDGFRFVKKNNKYTLTSYLGNSDTVTLPTDIDGEKYTVYHFTGAKNVIIPYGILQIDKESFRYSDIESVIISDSVTDIGEYAFGECRQLKNVVFGKAKMKIGARAFSGCNSLCEIVIPGNVYEIGVAAFMECLDLEKVTLLEGVKTLCDGAFKICPMLNDLILPDSLQSIGNEVFMDCDDLKQMVIPSGVSEIGISSFPKTLSLKFEDANKYFQMVDGILYDKPATKIVFVFDNNIKNVKVLDGVKAIPDGTFSNFDYIQSVEIPSSVETIGMNAFSNCGSLKSVTLSSGLKEIGPSAFAVCESLQSIRIPSGVTTVGSSAFMGCSVLSEVIIPSSVKRIDSNVFGNCDSLKQITIPSGLTQLGERVFSSTTEILVSGTLSNYKLINGVFYDKKMTKVICTSKTPAKVTIPDTVTYIPSFAFYGNSTLEEIVLPQKLTVIEDSTFASCSNLKKVVLPYELTTIGEGAFSSCDALTELTITENVTTIKDRAFMSCNNLYKVYNNSKLDLAIDSNDSSNLTCYAQVIIDRNGNTTYKEGCSGEIFIDTADGFRFVKDSEGYLLIAYLGNKTEITLPENFNGSVYKPYYFRSNAKKIIVPGNVNLNAEAAFSGNCNIEEVVLHNGIKVLGSSTFMGCRNLKKVDLPDDLIALGPGVFENCKSLGDIDIPDSVKLIGANVFEGSSYYVARHLWNNGLLIIDGWLIDVDHNMGIKYLTVNEDIIGVSSSAYDQCYMLKQSYWNNNNSLRMTNVETVICNSIYNPRKDFDMSENGYYFDNMVGSNALALKNVVITKNITTEDLYWNPTAFSKLQGVTIYVEALEKDLEWDENFPGWNYGNRVVYGDEWSWQYFYDDDGTLIYSAPRRNSDVIRLPIVDCRESYQSVYEVSGWDIDSDGKADSMPATSIVDLKALAIYSEIPYCDYYDHSYAVDTVAPTAYSKGYMLHTCVVCKDQYKDSFTEPLVYIVGDINNDNFVNSDDAVYLLKHTLFPDMYPTNQNADFDGNGELNSDDAVYLLKYTLFPDMYPLNVVRN